MDELTQICGVGSIATTTGQISVVAGVGAVEKIQAVNGTGAIARTTGNGGVNET